MFADGDLVSEVSKERKMSVAHLTLDLPLDLIRTLDREEKDRNQFVEEAIRNELRRRKGERVAAASEHPHPEAAQWAEIGFEDWVDHLPKEDVSELVDPAAGTAVCWTPGKGWSEVDP